MGLKQSRNADVMQKLEAATETARQGEDRHEMLQYGLGVNWRLGLRLANGSRRCSTTLNQTPRLIDSSESCRTVDRF